MQTRKIAADNGGSSSFDIWRLARWPHGRQAWCDPDYDTSDSFRRDWETFLDETDRTDTDSFLRWYFSVEDVNDIPDWASEVVAEATLQPA